eukprot:2587837-Prymnesium_polylepis.1
MGRRPQRLARCGSRAGRHRPRRGGRWRVAWGWGCGRACGAEGRASEGARGDARRRRRQRRGRGGEEAPPAAAVGGGMLR